MMKEKDNYEKIVEELSTVMDDDAKITEALNRLDKQELEALDRKNADSIPPKYENVIKQISESVYNGFICFLNPETLEFELASCKGFYEFIGPEVEEQNDDIRDEQGLTYTEWDHYIRFEPFNRNDLLNRIEKFVEQLNDSDLKFQLENISNKDVLYGKFRDIMARTGLLETWNSFKKQEIEDYVRTQLVSNLGYDVSATEDVYSL